MKNILLPLLLFFPLLALTQITNPSFENNGTPSLEHWFGICTNLASFENEGAPNSGEWSLRLQAGNTQGCITSEFYQVIPEINSGETVSLSAWIKSGGNITASFGIGLKSMEGSITVIASTGTDSTEWVNHTIESEVTFGATDSVIIFLSSGLTAGPIGGDDYYGLYDGLSLSVLTTSVQEPKNQIELYPNPVHDGLLYVKTSIPPSDFQSVCVYNCLGKKVFCTERFQQEFDLSGLANGIYFLQVGLKDQNFIDTFILKNP